MDRNDVIPVTPDIQELGRRLVVAPEPRRASDPADIPGHEPLATETRRFEDLPKELGVLLTSVGVLGFVMPGIAGTPALIAGGLVLWPKTFGKVEGWFSRRFPIAHRTSMQQVERFLDDLDRRYPRSESSEP